jgi:hypothetical protein
MINDPCYGPLYLETCKSTGVGSLSKGMRLPASSGIRACLPTAGVHYGMNIVDKVSRKEILFIMNTASSSTKPITQSSAITLPKTFKKTNSHKIENLIEYSYVPEDVQVAETIPPLLSPYNIFKRQKSLTRTIRNLISTNRPNMKEYIQSSRLDQCTLKATNQEQYVDLEITGKQKDIQRSTLGP